MNRLINTQDIISPLNRCYLDYADWPAVNNENGMNAFRYYIETTAGLRLTFDPMLDKKSGQYGFRVERAELVNEHLYLIWTLKWA